MKGEVLGLSKRRLWTNAEPLGLCRLIFRETDEDILLIILMPVAIAREGDRTFGCPGENDDPDPRTIGPIWPRTYVLNCALNDHCPAGRNPDGCPQLWEYAGAHMNLRLSDHSLHQRSETAGSGGATRTMPHTAPLACPGTLAHPVILEQPLGGRRRDVAEL